MNSAQHFAEHVLPWIIPFWIAFVFGIVVLCYWNSHRSVERRMKRIAQLYGGKVLSGVLFKTWSSVEIPRGKTCVKLYYSPAVHERGAQTYLSFDWSQSPLRCELFPEGFWNGLRKLMGLRDVTIGNAQFDGEFIISSDDETGVREFLSASVQQAIWGLDRFAAGEAFGRRCLHVQIGAGRITIALPRMLNDDAALAEFVRLGLALHEACHQSVLIGIRFLDCHSATMAHCMVCGEALASEVVYCRRCQTPHHRECWSYCGGCSTYGCRQKTFATKL